MSHRDLPLLIHLHIPKNAGTTLSRSLKLGLGTWPPTRLLRNSRTLGYYTMRGWQSRIERIARLDPARRRQVRFFEAHAGFGLHELLPKPNAYITMLREPIARALSAYYYLKQLGRLSHEGMTLREFALERRQGRIWWIDNSQVRYLAGEDGNIVTVPPGECDAALLDVAKQRLDRDFFFFGIVERFDHSMNLLRRLLGWRRLYYATSNVTRVRPKREEVPQEDIDLLTKLNMLDTELYRYALDRFEQRLHEQGPALEAEMERFKATNRRYNSTVGRCYSLITASGRVRRIVRDLRKRNNR